MATTKIVAFLSPILFPSPLQSIDRSSEQRQASRERDAHHRAHTTAETKKKVGEREERIVCVTRKSGLFALVKNDDEWIVAATIAFSLSLSLWFVILVLLLSFFCFFEVCVCKKRRATFRATCATSPPLPTKRTCGRERLSLAKHFLLPSLSLLLALLNGDDDDDDYRETNKQPGKQANRQASKQAIRMWQTDLATTTMKVNENQNPKGLLQ